MLRLERPVVAKINLELAKQALQKQRRDDSFVDRLCSLLEIPSSTGNEAVLAAAARQALKSSGCQVTQDARGNLYAVKGQADVYPLFMAHLDTVQVWDAAELWTADGWVGAVKKGTSEQCGPGGDDKCGVFVCLEMASRLPVVKIALFVEEEPGRCRGSRYAVKNHAEFFQNVGYGFEIDCPGIGVVPLFCGGVELFRTDGDFWRRIAPIIVKQMGSPDLTLPKEMGHTDVSFIRRLGNFPCVNLPAGYYDMHKSTELIRIDDLVRIIDGCEEIVTMLGPAKFDEGAAGQ